MRDCLSHQAQLADVGELVGPVAHEVNNFLNTVLLHMAVLEQQYPELKGDMAEIRRQGTAMARLTKQLQSYLHHLAANSDVVDLNQLLRDIITDQKESETRPIELHLSATALPVQGCADDILRLYRFLLKNMLSGQDRKIIHSGVRDDHARLTFTELGAALPREEAQEFLKADAPHRPGVSGLELAACQRITQRLRGTLRAENAKDGFAIVVELPLAKS